MRRFELHRDEDVSGVSGQGVVAEGVAFSNGGPVALRWLSEFPTSVVFHDRGIESLEAVHGHQGRTRIVWLDEPYDEHDVLSGMTVGGRRITWKKAYEREREHTDELTARANILIDLDRCEHGRHEGDVCSSCGGPSHGNLLLPEGAIGHTMSADRIVPPARADRYRAEAWVQPRNG